MSRHGKKYFNALKKAPQKPVSVEEAIKFVKANASAKFDETVDVYFHLGKDLTKGDTAVRGPCSVLKWETVLGSLVATPKVP